MLKTLSPSNGHALDIDPAELADTFLSLAQNVHTRKRFPSRIDGRRQAYGGIPATVAAFHLLPLRFGGFDWWMQFFSSTVEAMQTTLKFGITPAGITAVTSPFEWNTTLLNGIPVATNGKNNPYTWNGSGASAMTAIPGWPAVTTICHAIAAFRFHLFAMNIDAAAGTSDNLVMWSAAAAANTLPATWTPAAGNEAGSALLAETPGRCICGVPLQQQLAVYKPQSIYAMEYIGQPNIFNARAVIRSIGALGPKCVLEVAAKTGTAQHLVLGNDDVILYDGVNAVSIASDRIKLYLGNSIDDTNAQNAFIVRDPNKRETWVCVPEKGNTFANVAHVYDEQRNTWVTRDMNAVRHSALGIVTDTTASQNWDADAAAWDSDNTIWNEQAAGGKTRIMSSEAGGYFLEDTNDLVTVQSRLARYDISFDDDTQRKVTKRVWIRGTGAISGLQVRLGARESPDDTITWGTFVTVVPGEGNPYEVEGRYISVEVSHLGTAIYTVNRIIIEADYVGAY